jgi:hypothetical protein
VKETKKESRNMELVAANGMHLHRYAIHEFSGHDFADFCCAVITFILITFEAFLLRIVFNGVAISEAGVKATEPSPDLSSGVRLLVAIITSNGLSGCAKVFSEVQLVNRP